MGFDIARLTAEDKDAENGSELKGNWDKLNHERAGVHSRAAEHNVKNPVAQKILSLKSVAG